LAGISEAEEWITAAYTDLGRLQMLQHYLEIYQIKTRTLDRATADVNRSYTDLAAAEKELTDAWAVTGGICPLCEQAVVHAH
jgi:hypothetical protein